MKKKTDTQNPETTGGNHLGTLVFPRISGFCHPDSVKAETGYDEKDITIITPRQAATSALSSAGRPRADGKTAILHRTALQKKGKAAIYTLHLVSPSDGGKKNDVNQVGVVEAGEDGSIDWNYNSRTLERHPAITKLVHRVEAKRDREANMVPPAWAEDYIMLPLYVPESGMVVIGGIAFLPNTKDGNHCLECVRDNVAILGTAGFDTGISTIPIGKEAAGPVSDHVVDDVHSRIRGLEGYFDGLKRLSKKSLEERQSEIQMVLDDCKVYENIAEKKLEIFKGHAEAWKVWLDEKQANPKTKTPPPFALIEQSKDQTADQAAESLVLSKTLAENAEVVAEVIAAKEETPAKKAPAKKRTRKPRKKPAAPEFPTIKAAAMQAKKTGSKVEFEGRTILYDVAASLWKIGDEEYTSANSLAAVYG